MHATYTHPLSAPNTVTVERIRSYVAPFLPVTSHLAHHLDRDLFSPSGARFSLVRVALRNRDALAARLSA